MYRCWFFSNDKGIYLVKLMLLLLIMLVIDHFLFKRELNIDAYVTMFK